MSSHSIDQPASELGASNVKAIKFKYGKSQAVASQKMRRFPVLSKLVSKVFGYTNIGNYARAKIFLKVLKKLPARQFKDILDLGCGQGEYTAMMAGTLKSSQIVALDVSKQAIETAERIKEEINLSNISTFHGDAWKYKGEAVFDFIYSVDVFEHILKEEMPFKPCYKLLREGGYFLVKMPTDIQRHVLPDNFFGEQLVWVDDEHIGQVYDLDRLKQRVEEVGFDIKYASYSDGLLARFAWEVAYLSKKGGMILQLLFLPLCKLMVMVDGVLPHKKTGNAIMVIAQKVQR